MIKIYKTYEIDDRLWQEIVDGFNESFDLNTNIQSFKSGFCVANQLGYGYHAVAFDDETGEVKGFNTYTPTFYKDGIKAFVSGSTFVKKKYRKDIFIFGDLISCLRKKGFEEGYDVEIGVPNHNSREYVAKFLKSTFVGDLNYYIFPRNISRCLHKPKIKYVDCIVKFLSNIYLSLYRLYTVIYNCKEKEAKYSLIVDEDYIKARFKSEKYSHYVDGEFSSYFRIVNEDGTKAAYLMDFREGNSRTGKSLYKAVRYIIKNEDPDAILFIGFLRMNQHFLFKVPSKFIPKPLPLTYYVLDKKNKTKFSDMSNPDNWNFSLMNFDVR
jgi:hypothetical protein